MSEIEKMYKNAGCTNMWVQRYNDGYYEHERYYNSYKEMIRNMMKANDWTLVEAQEVAKRECKKEHPPFTAEKQIELIKWLASKQYAKYTTSLLINIKDTVRFSGGLIAGVCTLNVRYDKQDKDFENALAGLINEMWQSLTPEEHKQIKEILS